jgi:ABC-type sugar transport system substrate-binding protein
MEKEVSEAVAELKAQGIPVVVNATGSPAEAYVATVPNGEKYCFSAAGLLELKAKGKLHLEGLQEAHLARKAIPNL